MEQIAFNSFTVSAPNGWVDITKYDTPDQPYSLGRRDGVGALQFSIALYRGGKVPDPTPQRLLEMLKEFAASHGLGEADEIATESDPVRLAAGSLRDGEWFVRVWYVSDGLSFGLVTYTCDWEARDKELAECEQIVRSISIRSGSGARPPR
jgi:hypothetical protein